MKKHLKIITALILTVVMLAGISAQGVLAAGSETKKTLKSQAFSLKTSVVDPKAKEVETGKYRVVMPSKGKGYLKFTAPKKGTYTFRVSDIQKYKENSSKYGCFQIFALANKKGTKLKAQKVTTNGGVNNTLWVGPKVVTKYTDKNGDIVKCSKNNWTLKARYGKIKLKKNQVVYLYFNFYKKDSVRLTISQS